MYQRYEQIHDDAKLIRKEVFVEEQGFHDEFDETDDAAVHLVFYEDNIPAAVCRYFPSQTPGEYKIGRVAVRSRFRNRHLGTTVMQTAEENIRRDGGHSVVLSAQLRVKDFYEKNGYTAFGDVYMDESCEHIRMKKTL